MMKKNVFFLILPLFLLGCKSYWINKSFKYNGFYDDTVKLKTTTYLGKTIVFIPMHHLGTEGFYSDVKYKIDSLKNIGYYFLYENLNIERKNDVDVRKIRKILRSPLTQPKFGYKKLIDSLFPNIKYTKKMVDQPPYEEWSLVPENSRRADTDLQNIISYYENKYGEIKLTDCDFKTSIFEKYTKCREENKVTKKQSNDVLINFRNEVVVQSIKESPYKKITIIYGKGHIDGIIKKLSEQDKN
ncbi:MAG: hypothetical protein QM564_10860 [Bergeyella sp.]